MTMSEFDAVARARKRVTISVYRGIELRMTGDKTLVGLSIPPEIIARRSIGELEETLKEGINRARIAADYDAGSFVLRATGLIATVDEAAELLDGEEPEARHALVPELNAGIYAFLRKRSWTLADLAERSGLDEKLLEDLLSSRYPPFEAIGSQRTLSEVMDLAAPIARACGVTPLELWRAGRGRIAAGERASRNLLKRVAKGFLLNLRRRKPGKKKLPDLRLGTLIESGVMPELELQVRIQEENLIEVQRTRKDWMPWRRRREWKGDGDYGYLLGPNGELLRESVSQDEIKKLHALDRKAAADPASITDEELGWVRELLGVPTLEVATPASKAELS